MFLSRRCFYVHVIIQNEYTFVGYFFLFQRAQFKSIYVIKTIDGALIARCDGRLFRFFFLLNFRKFAVTRRRGWKSVRGRGKEKHTGGSK